MRGRKRERWNCDVDGCDGLHHARGLCKKHYASLRHREVRVEQPLKGRDKNLRQCYGLTLDEYEQLAEIQNRKCAICGCEQRPDAMGRDRLHVDHDHETGRVRGLLCSGCNIGLGNFAEDPARLESAARYIRGEYR